MRHKLHRRIYNTGPTGGISGDAMRDMISNDIHTRTINLAHERITDFAYHDPAVITNELPTRGRFVSGQAHKGNEIHGLINNAMFRFPIS